MVLSLKYFSRAKQAWFRVSNILQESQKADLEPQIFFWSNRGLISSLKYFSWSKEAWSWVSNIFLTQRGMIFSLKYFSGAKMPDSEPQILFLSQKKTWFWASNIFLEPNKPDFEPRIIFWRRVSREVEPKKHGSVQGEVYMNRQLYVLVYMKQSY